VNVTKEINPQYPPPDIPNITTNATSPSIEEECTTTASKTPKEKNSAVSHQFSEANGVIVSPATDQLKYQPSTPSMTTNATSPSNIRDDSTATAQKLEILEPGAHLEETIKPPPGEYATDQHDQPHKLDILISMIDASFHSLKTANNTSTVSTANGAVSPKNTKEKPEDVFQATDPTVLPSNIPSMAKDADSHTNIMEKLIMIALNLAKLPGAH